MTTSYNLEISLKIMELLITKGNLMVMPKEATNEHLNGLSRKRKAMVQPVTLLVTGFYL